MGDTEVDVASLVYSGDHADPRLDLLGLDTIVCSIRSPVPSSEITHSKPSLIQRDVILLLEVGAKKVQSPLLT